MPEPDFFIKQGDTASHLSDVLLDANSDPVNITGADVTFSMRPIGGGDLVVDHAAASNDDVNESTRGNVHYEWAAAVGETPGDTDVAGWFLGEWEVTFVDGSVQTFPNGGYVLIAIQEQLVDTSPHYVTLEQLKASKELTGFPFADETMRRALLAAEQGVEGVCGQRFWLDAEDETRYFAPASAWRAFITPLTELTSFTVDRTGDGSFGETWDAEHIVLGPLNAALDNRPYTWVQPSAFATYRAFPTHQRAIAIEGRFGWPVVPDAVKQAVELLAARIAKRTREAPFAIVGLGSETAIRLARTDPDVMFLLQDFIRTKALAA